MQKIRRLYSAQVNIALKIELRETTSINFMIEFARTIEVREDGCKATKIRNNSIILKAEIKLRIERLSISDTSYLDEMKYKLEQFWKIIILESNDQTAPIIDKRK